MENQTPGESAEATDPTEGAGPAEPTERTGLKLAPRGSTPASAPASSSKPNPFGTAKPREEVLIQKGVDPKEVEQKIEAKVVRPRFSKEQEEQLAQLQEGVDAETDPAAAAAKKAELEEVVAKFKEAAITEKPAVRKFERPSERVARLEAAGQGQGRQEYGSGGKGGSASSSGRPG